MPAAERNIGQPAARLVVFARLPVPGKCKTRLAATIGADAAAECYRICAQHAFKQAHRCASVVAEVHCSDASEVEAMEHWLADNGTPMPVQAQAVSKDLGVRMHCALAAAAANAKEAGIDNAKVLVMGTDIPSLTAAELTGAVAALDTAELVLGPAADGGYYLLGTRHSCLTPLLFENMTWSTPDVLATTVQRAAKCGLVVAPRGALPTLHDIDTKDDLAAWVAALKPGQGAVDGQSTHRGHPLYAYAMSCLGHNTAPKQY